MAFSSSWELPPPSASPPEVLPLPPSSAPPSTATPRLRRRFLRFLPRERCRARGFQTGRRRVEEIYMGRVRGGGKRRRLVIDDSSPSPQAPCAASKGRASKSSSRHAAGAGRRSSSGNAGGSYECSDAPSAHPAGAPSLRFPGAILTRPSLQGQSWPPSSSPSPSLPTDAARNVDGRSHCHDGACGLSPSQAMLSYM